jgi:hypothetical protein
LAATDVLIAAIEHHTGRTGKKAGRNTRLLCPCHDDHNPSLDVAEGDNGSPVAICRSCGAGLEQVAQAIGHAIGDYLPTQAPQGEWTPLGPAVATYPYVDERSALLYEVCRTADKQFPVRRPDATAKHGWRWNLDGVRRVPYRLPAVLAAARDGATVYVCEGEKDVHAIERAGAVATCNPGGAGKWREEYTAALHGAKVIIVADNDEKGLEHARTVAASLAASGNGHGDSVPIVRALSGKDAYDHLAAGHTLEEFVPVDAAPLTLAPFAMTLTEFLTLDLPAAIPLVGNSEDEAVIAAHSFTILAGMPGAGKTTLAIDFAFHLASGQPWLNMAISDPRRILIMENEGPERAFQRKLAAKHTTWKHGGQENIYVHTWRWNQLSLQDDDAQDQLRHFLTQNAIDLVIADPLDSFGTDGIGSPADTEAFTQLLKSLGLGTTVAYFFLHHFRKEISLSEINQVSGAWGRRLDALLVLKETERKDELRLSFPKLRWQDTEPAPLILGKIKETRTFQVLGEETHETDSNKVDAMLSRIISVLRKTGPMERQKLALTCETGASDRTFQRSLRKGLDMSKLEAEENGRKKTYFLPPSAYE